MRRISQKGHLCIPEDYIEGKSTSQVLSSKSGCWKNITCKISMYIKSERSATMTTSEKHPAATSLGLLSGRMGVFSKADPLAVLFNEMAARS